MTSLLLLQAVLAFTAHEIPGLVVTPPAMLAPHPEFNFDAEDLNGDGAMDLVFTDHVLLQRDGVFPQEARLPLPAFTQPGWLDAADGSLCVLLLEGGNSGRACTFQRYVLEDGAWKQTESRTLQDAGEACAATGDLALLPFVQGHRFAWFDGTSIHYQDIAGANESTSLRSIAAPAPSALLDRAPALWPAPERSFVVLESGLRARLLSKDDTLELWRWRSTAAGSWLTRTAWSWPDEGGPLPAATSFPSVWLAPGEQPALLDGDHEPDIVSWVREESALLELRLPATKLTVKLSGQDATWSTLAQAPGAACPSPRIKDLNGDGLADVALLTLNPTRNSVRENALQLLTRATLTAEVQCFLQSPASTFPTRPSFRHTLEIALDAPPIQGGQRLDAFAAGGLVSLDGDVNGDGFNDLVAHTRPGKVVIHAGGAEGFDAAPLATVDIPEQARIAVYDLNGDGKAELIAHLPDLGASALVYFP